MDCMGGWSISRVGRVAVAAGFLLCAGCFGGDDEGGIGGGGSCTLAQNKCAFGCDVNVGCIECLSDADCGGGKRVCVLGDCQECGRTGSDCATGQACFPKDYKYEDACDSDGDCNGDSPLCDVATSGRRPRSSSNSRIASAIAAIRRLAIMRKCSMLALLNDGRRMLDKKCIVSFSEPRLPLADRSCSRRSRIALTAGQFRKVAA